MGNRIEKSLIVDLHNNNIKSCMRVGRARENNLNSSQHTTWTYRMVYFSTIIVLFVRFSFLNK